MKVKMEFDGFERLCYELQKVGVNIERTTEKALKECQKAVTPGIKNAIKPHRRTGKTESTLQENTEVKWVGDVASIGIGFNIRQGGMPSIFLMYGTPRISPDQKLYNSIYGSAVKRKVKQIEKDIFINELTERLLS